MRDRWRTAALLLAVVVAAAALWGRGQMQQRRTLENELLARYQQAFFDAVSHVESVEVLLSKGLAASTPERLADVFSDVRLRALAAQASFSSLPLPAGTLAETSKFLVQVGDFAFSLAKKAAKGAPPSQEEIDLAHRLRQEAARIGAALHEMQLEAAKGRAPWGALPVGMRARARAAGDAGGAARFRAIEEQVQKIPVIQYDGPFSDHVLSRKPRSLSGDDIDEARAEAIALEFLPEERRQGYRAEARRRVEGKIRAYGITASPREGDGPEVVLDVSVTGGHVVWMLTKRDVAASRISLEEAVERARRFLEERGFGEMEPTYAGAAENVAVIPFVRIQDGVRIYPDQVKVSVALDDGEVVGFEALGYLMAHTERRLPSPAIRGEEAARRVAAGLEVDGAVRLALIPAPAGDEVLTWEVPARMGDARFLVYINAVTGEEENILRLVETGEGAMTL